MLLRWLQYCDHNFVTFALIVLSRFHDFVIGFLMQPICTPAAAPRPSSPPLWVDQRQSPHNSGIPVQIGCNLFYLNFELSKDD